MLSSSGSPNFTATLFAHSVDGSYISGAILAQNIAIRVESNSFLDWGFGNQPMIRG